MPDHMPSGGLLRRAFQQAEPPVPPEQWLTQERPALAVRSQPAASQPASRREVSQGQQARPAAPTPPASRSKSSRWIMLGSVLVLILAGIWAVKHPSASIPAQSAQAGRATPASNLPTATAPASASGTPSAASPTPSASATTGIQQLSAAFLAAYFTWSASDSDATYTSHWHPFVADTAARDLVQAAPRLTLDDGNDGAATSAAPTIPASAVQISGKQARVQVAWTIRVLPDGGELVQWQTRRIQATLTLIASASGWQIAGAVWTSTDA